MQKRDIQYLEAVLKAHYASNAGNVQVPATPEAREFGYQTLASDWKRHLALADIGSLGTFLASTAPASAYCSAAYYERPSSIPMETKGWRGTDLIFDIDAKDLKQACRADHAVYRCRNCDKSYKAAPKCCDGKHDSVSLPCTACVGAALRQAEELTKILVDAFGACPDSIKTYFSGNEGYHVHVTDPQFHKIKSAGRAEIAGYVLSRDIQVDVGVTTDLTRIFRMPGTLSAKSGMAKTECKDPFVDAVLLGSEMITVIADCPHVFALNGRKFGPYCVEEASVPEYAAVYMISKGLAHVA